MNPVNSKFHAFFRCINLECKATYQLDEIIYKCSKCGELLEVFHDLNRLKAYSPDEWRELFDSRLGSIKFPDNSGIWNKREWVLPAIDSKNIVSCGEGNTYLFSVERLAKELSLDELYVKQCGVSHTGSFKDLGMTVLVSQVNQMIQKNIPIKAVACASTGDTSAALAAYAAKAGIPTIVFLPKDKVSTAQLIQPVSNGAKVISLDTDFDGCMKIVQQVSEDNSIYLANSMNSLRIEGQKTISIEITQQLGWRVPDWIIIPGGNLGNVSAIGAGFEMMHELRLINRLPRICLAQSANANPLYLSYLKNFEEFHPIEAKKTLASAIQIGDPVSVKKAIRTIKKFDGIVEHATETELANAASRCDRYGLYNDPHTGVALAALFKLIEKEIIQRGESVVVISTANGLKFTEFKLAFHLNQLSEIDSKIINQIIPCKADINSVMDIIQKL